jgi:hypothetical protein
MKSLNIFYSICWKLSLCTIWEEILSGKSWFLCNKNISIVTEKLRSKSLQQIVTGHHYCCAIGMRLAEFPTMKDFDEVKQLAGSMKLIVLIQKFLKLLEKKCLYQIGLSTQPWVELRQTEMEQTAGVDQEIWC